MSVERYLVWAAFCVAAMCPLAGAMGADFPAPAPIEEKAVAARRAIHSGELEIKVERWDTRGERRKEYDEELTIVFDGERFRIERRQLLPLLGKSADGQAAKRVYVATDSDLFYYSNVVAADGTPRMAQVGRRESMGSYAGDIVDPRRIGMVPDPFTSLHALGIDTVLTRPDRRRSSTQPEVVDGEKLERIEYERNDGCLLRVWISPEKNCGVVRMEIEARVEGSTLLDSVENKLRSYGNDAVWFPETATVRRRENGALLYEDVTTIRRAAFNQPIDPGLFAMTGLGMPLGHHVFDVTRAFHGTWDGETVVGYSKPTDGVPLEVRPRIGWVLVSVASGVLALIVVWIRARRVTNRSR